MHSDSLADDPLRLRYAQVLVELGELGLAEREIAEIVDNDATNLTALSLLAKIKHMRGELSQAIALWAHVHAQSPHNELALMCLRSILQLVNDPERAAGEFLALGGFQIARKPAAHLELEKALREFLAHRPEEARASCDRLAAKYESEREIYKLAIMAKAWIAELSGDLEAAALILERLGKERGFETDTDRILALARVYERLGTTDRLEKAAHIFRFLERSFEKISALARLAQVYRRLGRTALAEEYDQRYFVAFQRRMHRVSTLDVASVAAARYLPLEGLRRVRRTPLVSPASSASPASDERSTRELALEAFMQDEPAKARELFQLGGTLLDAKYVANLDIIEGKLDSGLEGYVAALREDPDDARLLGALLDQHDRMRSHGIVSALREPALYQRLTQNLEAALRASPLSPTPWRNMAALRRILGEKTEASRYAERASALQAASDRDTQPVGRVLAAAVFHFVGKAKGLIHQIWVDRTPAEPSRGGFLSTDDILGNVTMEMKQSIRNTFFAVREYARSRFPQQTTDILDYNYTYKVTKEDEPSGGLSAGLPTALAFLSVFLQKPVPQHMAFSGVLIADSHDALVVRSVGEAEYKVKGAYNRNLRILVLPMDNRSEVLGNPLIPSAACEEIVRYARNLDDAVKLTFGEEVWVE